jgi:hypothetical protein
MGSFSSVVERERYNSHVPIDICVSMPTLLEASSCVINNNQ